MKRKGLQANMKTRTVSLALIILLLIIPGCSESDETEPTPRPQPVLTPSPEPSPVTECDHFWKSPDCQNPYICYDCDETKGLPTEHVWKNPNFQVAYICENCGEIFGEPLEPGFDIHGLRINTTSGRPFPYKTITRNNPEMATTGVATLLYIDFFDSDTDYPAKAGYEYVVTRIMITFEDENSQANGYQYMTGQTDFFVYDPDEPAVSYDDFRESNIPGFKIVNRKINYYGEDYEYYIKHSQVQNEWVGGISYVVLEYAFLIPAGYDGVVVYITNAANWSGAGNSVISENFDNDTLFFRLRLQSN